MRIFLLGGLLLTLLAHLPGQAQRTRPAAPARRSSAQPAPLLTPTSAAPAEAWETVFFEQPTVTLPVLTAAAIGHSALIKSLVAERGIGEQDIAIARKSILGSVSLNGAYTYGNLLGIYVTDLSGGPSSVRTTSRYGVGASMALPLDRIVSRGNFIKRAELGRDREEAMRQDREDLVRQQLIQLYQNVLLARRLLTLRQQAFVNLQTASHLAESQFAQNELTLTELTSTTAALTEATVAQESARSQYDTTFMLLEEVVGTKISTLLAPAAP